MHFCSVSETCTKMVRFLRYLQRVLTGLIHDSVILAGYGYPSGSYFITESKQSFLSV